MTRQQWVIAALKAATYTLCVWAALWLFSMPDHHPSANWFFVGLAFLVGFWDGHNNTKGAP